MTLQTTVSGDRSSGCGTFLTGSKTTWCKRLRQLRESLRTCQLEDSLFMPTFPSDGQKIRVELHYTPSQLEWKNSDRQLTTPPTDPIIAPEASLADELAFHFQIVWSWISVTKGWECIRWLFMMRSGVQNLAWIRRVHDLTPRWLILRQLVSHRGRVSAVMDRSELWFYIW